MYNLEGYKLNNNKNIHFESFFIKLVEVRLLNIKKDLVKNEFKK